VGLRFIFHAFFYSEIPLESLFMIKCAKKLCAKIVILLKGRLQSLLRMSVIVFAWGLHRKLGISVYTRSSLISGNNTRVVFFASEGVKLEVSKIYIELF
jgi:hypothetical protein